MTFSGDKKLFINITSDYRADLSFDGIALSTVYVNHNTKNQLGLS